jgi:hypothetical protein
MAKITSDSIKREIGVYLGYDRSPGNWSASEADDVEAVIDSGERQFYTSAIDPESGIPHVWSFLTRALSVAVPENASEVDFPSDFTRMIGKLTVSPGGGTLSLVDEGHLRSLHAAGGEPGKPSYYSLVKSDYEDDYRVLLYPEADTQYTLTTRYVKRYVTVSTDASAPELYSEVLLASCMAAAERTFRPELGFGVQQERYASLLVSAIRQDQSMSGQQEEADIWPTDEPVSDLNVNKAYLKRVVGRQLGYGASSSVWTPKQTAEVDEAVRTGLRIFYNPPAIQGERMGHEWSFLKGLGFLGISSGKHEYDLPEDFARLHGPITYAPVNSILWEPIRIVGEYQVRELMQEDGSSFRPTIAAIRPKNGNNETRWEIVFWPAPDGSYDLTYRYWRNPVSLSDDASLPLGGQPHAQTVVDSCLAAVEAMQGGAGRYSERFQERLATSVWHDRRVTSPDTLGVDRDRGVTYFDMHNHTSYTITPPTSS